MTIEARSQAPHCLIVEIINKENHVQGRKYLWDDGRSHTVCLFNEQTQKMSSPIEVIAYSQGKGGEVDGYKIGPAHCQSYVTKRHIRFSAW